MAEKVRVNFRLDPRAFGVLKTIAERRRVSITRVVEDLALGDGETAAMVHEGVGLSGRGKKVVKLSEALPPGVQRGMAAAAGKQSVRPSVAGFDPDRWSEEEEG